MNTSYVYQPLDRVLNEIRLVKIFSSPETNPLCCEIIQKPLRSSPQFGALSYTWQSPYPDDDVSFNKDGDDGKFARSFILINGAALAIFDNLRNALEALSRRHSSQYLWIDAVCIDQSNIQEREYQVGLMGRIFSQADHVLVWLGPSSPCSQRAIAFIRKLATSPDDETGQHARVLRLATACGSVDTWTALRNLVTRTWWQRAWIVQEYTLGSEIVFICG